MFRRVATGFNFAATNVVGGAGCLNEKLILPPVLGRIFSSQALRPFITSSRIRLAAPTNNLPDLVAREQTIPLHCTPEALMADAYPSAVDSTEVWKKILAVLGKDKKLCLLRGGCQTGKTSLFAAGQFLSLPGQFMAGNELRYLLPAATDTSAKRIAEKVSESGGISIQEVIERILDKNLILFIDEAHSWFASKEESPEGKLIRNLLKINTGRKCRVLFITTSTLDDARPNGVTPIELKDRQLWFVGPTTDRTRVEDYIKLCLTREKSATLVGMEEDDSSKKEVISRGNGDIVKIATKSLFDMCGCNIGLVSAAIRELQKTNSLSPFQLHDCRALMGGNGGLNHKQQEVMMELLALGKVTIAMSEEDKDSPGKELVRRGYLVPSGLERRSELESVHDFDESSSTEFTFANALQAERMRGLLPNCMELKKDTRYETALDFVFALLPAMPSWCFASAASDPQSSSQLLEASLQHGVSVAAASLGVQPFVEMASRYQTKKRGRPHAVDLVVNSSRFAKGAHYAIELLTDGSIDKHQKYFRNGGQHSRYNEEGRCVVLSFHTSSHGLYEKLSALGNDIPVVAVAPHLRFGWSFYTVVYFGVNDKVTKVTLPRHGIPLDRSGKPLTIYRKQAYEFWVSVTLPDTEVVLVNITAEVKETSSDISGLKKAVLKELGLNQQGKFPQHLTVYPPGKKKDGMAAITKMSTPLQDSSEAEPYRVEVQYDAVRDTKAEYWVSVTLPNTKVVPVNITAAVKEISSDISGLKKAVLKELAVELEGKGISHLTVYPPGKKKDGQAAITKMSTPLKSTTEDEPYHVEAGSSRLIVYPPGQKKDGQALDVGDALKSASRAEPYHVEVGDGLPLELHLERKKKQYSPKATEQKQKGEKKGVGFLSL